MTAAAVALLVNPRSGRGVDPARLAAAIERQGPKVDTFERGDHEAVARAAPDRLAIASGDGSLGPAAELAGRLDVPLAVVPTGTANNFAAAQGIPRDLERACRLAGAGDRTRVLELGRADGVPFVNLASAGLAPVAAERAVRLKRLLGPASYTVGAGVAAITTRPVTCEVLADDRSVFDGDAWQVMVASSGAFGPGVRVEGTDTGDGVLDVVVLAAGARTDLVRRGWWMKQGRIATQPGAIHARAATIDVRAPAEAPYNVDGEVVRLGPTRFTAEPAAFRLVVP